MRTVLKVSGILLLALLLVGAGFLGWASVATNQTLGRTFDTHAVDFPIPFPLTAEELGELGLEADPDNAVARERAYERGRHLVQARYVCGECHGQDFGGGVRVDAFPIGRLLGPNLTLGAGSRTLEYVAADWDRIVRHGVRPDGTPTVMPSEDFLLMSDQELSDIIVYIRGQPPVDSDVPPISLGPLGRILVATGQIHLSADLVVSHAASHTALPPASAVTVEFGRHLAGVCTGCHGAELTGGAIAGGDPSWVPARNLTPHETGLAEWTYDDFVAAMREATRPDGTALQAPMTFITPAAQIMTEVELQALWLYLQSLAPLPAR